MPPDSPSQATPAAAASIAKSSPPASRQARPTSPSTSPTTPRRRPTALPSSPPRSPARSSTVQAGRGRCRPLPLHGQGRRAVGLRGQRGPLRVEARLVHRGARQPGPPHPAGAAPGGARLVLHVPRQGRHRDRRLPPLQLGGDEAQRVSLCQWRGRQALALSPRARFGIRRLSRPGEAAGATSTRRRWRTALGEPCYIVEPHPPGTKLVPNGLPVFPLYFDNDDDSHRELGKDSRLSFHGPGRRRVSGQDQGRARPARARFPLYAHDPPASPRFQGDAPRRRPDG